MACGSRRACATKPRLCALRASTLPRKPREDAGTDVTAATSPACRKTGCLRRLTRRAPPPASAPSRQAAPARRLGRPPRRRDANARCRRRRRRLRRRHHRHAETTTAPVAAAQQHNAQCAPQPTPQRARHHTRTRQATPAGRSGATESAAATLNRCSPQSPPPPASHKRNRRAEKTHHERARDYAESKRSRQEAAPTQRRSHLAWWHRSTHGAPARRRGRRGRMPPRRGADTARIGDDDDDGPARRLLPNPHIPTSPRRVMSLRQPLSSRRCTCRRAQRAPWQILVRRVAFVVRVGTAILNSSRDHCRGIVRRAAHKFKFHVEGVLARGRRAEKPPFARVLPRPTHQTSRCDAGVNREERQTIDTKPPRGVTAVVVHGARRGVVAMANRRTPKIPRIRACHVTQTHVRTMP